MLCTLICCLKKVVIRGCYRSSGKSLLFGKSFYQINHTRHNQSPIVLVKTVVDSRLGHTPYTVPYQIMLVKSQKKRRVEILDRNPPKKLIERSNEETFPCECTLIHLEEVTSIITNHSLNFILIKNLYTLCLLESINQVSFSFNYSI